MKGMHRCLEEIEGKTTFDTILVDGTYFPYYTDKNFEVVNHVCVKGGDDTYQSIAAASILAKVYRDRYIVKLVSEETCLEAYDIANNKGYGTKKHMVALRERGPTKYHRLSFKPCQTFFSVSGDTRTQCVLGSFKQCQTLNLFRWILFSNLS